MFMAEHDLIAGMRAYRVSWRADVPSIETGVVCLRGRQRKVHTRDGQWHRAALFCKTIAGAITWEVELISYRGSHGHTYRSAENIYDPETVIDRICRLSRLIAKLKRHRLLGVRDLRVAFSP